MNDQTDGLPVGVLAWAELAEPRALDAQEQKQFEEIKRLIGETPHELPHEGE